MKKSLSQIQTSTDKLKTMSSAVTLKGGYKHSHPMHTLPSSSRVAWSSSGNSQSTYDKRRDRGRPSERLYQQMISYSLAFLIEYISLTKNTSHENSSQNKCLLRSTILGSRLNLEPSRSRCVVLVTIFTTT
jgi:hypothetical protein